MCRQIIDSFSQLGLATFCFLLAIGQCEQVLALPGEIAIDSAASWEGQVPDSTVSIAWGDVDGDGDLDLASANGTSGPIRIYFNRGNSLEEFPRWESLDSTCGLLAWADYDKDGDLDLACGGALYQNLGGVLDKSPLWITEPRNCGKGAWADFDRDGDLDLAVGSTLYQNNNGHLAPIPTWAAWDTVLTYATWGDFNNDSWPDLVCNDHIYMNRSGILDVAAVWKSSYFNCTSNAVGDVNGDGFFDLVLGFAGTEVQLFLNNSGDSICHNATWKGFDWNSNSWFVASSVALGDLDRDLDLDLVCSYVTSHVPNDPSQGTTAYLNTGDSLEWFPSWRSERATFATTDYPQSMALGDLDSDGDLDIATGNSGLGSVKEVERVYRNNGLFVESNPIWEIPDLDFLFNFDLLGDIDLDGDFDVVGKMSALGSGTYKSVWKNNGGELSQVPVYVSSDARPTKNMALQDINKDGFPDLVCIGGNYEHHYLYTNRNGAFDATPSWISAGSQKVTEGLDLGDVDGDGYPELAIANAGFVMGGPQGDDLYKNQDGTFESGPSWLSQDPFHSYAVAFADFDQDGDQDLAIGKNGLNKIHLNHNGTLNPFAEWSASDPGFTFGLDWGDADGDGDLDLACIGYQGPTRIFYNINNRLETFPKWTSEERFGRNAGFLDLDGDGDLDLGLSGNGFIANLDGLMSSASGYMLPKFDAETEINAIMAIGDIDNDTDLDYFIRHVPFYPDSLGTRSLRLLRGNRVQLETVARLPNTPPVARNLHMVSFDTARTELTIAFSLVDFQSDPCRVHLEYSPIGGGYWLPASTSPGPSVLASSASGIQHLVIWDAERDGVDGDDVIVRLRVAPNDANAGEHRWPTQNYPLNIGRIDGRPYISVIYPPQGSEVAASFPAIGKIWDATNFRDYAILVSRLPDTTEWTELEYSLAPAPETKVLSHLDLSTQGPGQYVLRFIASDRSGNRRILDRSFSFQPIADDAPYVIATYPVLGQEGVPLNAPVVVQFSRAMNSATLDGGAVTLTSESGTKSIVGTYDYKSRTYTLSTPGLLEERSMYVLTVSGQVAAQEGVALGTDFVTSFRTSQGPPTTDVVAMLPARGETAVLSSLSGLSITYVGPSVFRFVEVTDLQRLNDFRHAVSDTWIPANIPVEQLQPSTYYLVRVSDVDPVGTGRSDFMSYFITDDTKMPTVVDFSPTDSAWLVGLEQQIRVVFNKPLNTHSVESSSFYMIGPSGRVDGFLGFGSIGDSVVTFDPSAPYLPGSEYSVTLNEGIKDVLGNSIDAMTWAFSTGAFASIPYDGGILHAPGLDVKMSRGTFASDTEVAAGRIPLSMIDRQDDAGTAIAAFDLTPAVSLRREALLNFDLAEILGINSLDYTAMVNSVGQLDIYFYSSRDSAWQIIGGTQDSQQIICSISEFGRYGVFQRTETPTPDVSKHTALSIFPRVISPRQHGVNSSLQVSYWSQESVGIKVLIYDSGGNLVRVVTEDAATEPGENIYLWDGRNTNGELANDGLYAVVVTTNEGSHSRTFVVMNR